MTRAVEDLNRRLLRARDAMDRAYAEPLDVSAVGAVAHLSEAHFSRSFRAAFGETPHRDHHEPMAVPNCYQMAATRPRAAAGWRYRSSSFGEAAAAGSP